jgi:hypothetical protein
MPPKIGGTSPWRFRTPSQLELILSDYCIKSNTRPYGQALLFNSGDIQHFAPTILSSRVVVIGQLAL